MYKATTNNCTNNEAFQQKYQYLILNDKLKEIDYLTNKTLYVNGWLTFAVDLKLCNIVCNAIH